MQLIWCFSSSLACAPEQYAALLERVPFRHVNHIDGIRCHYSGSCACLRAQPEPWCQLRVKSGGEDLRRPMSSLLLTTDVTNA